MVTQIVNGMVTNIVKGLEWFEGREAMREREGSGEGVRKGGERDGEGWEGMGRDEGRREE